MRDFLQIDLNQMPWQAHPMLPGIMARSADVRLDGHPVIDTMMAQLGPQGAPWHQHETTCEIAYALSGSGMLLIGDQANPTRTPMTAGSIVFIAPKVPHAVTCDADDPLCILILHTLADP